MAVHLYLRVIECIFKEEKDSQNKIFFHASCRPNGLVTSRICISHLTYPNRHYLCEGVVSRMHEFRHIWWRLSRANETCHILMRHVTSRMNQACRTWMRHVVSRMNEACRKWMSHGTHNWGMSHMNEPCDRSNMNVSCCIWMCHVTYEWVICMSHVTWEWVMSHMTYGWVMSHINESCHIPKETFSDIPLWAIAHMNESCHIWMSLATCELVLSHITYGWVMSHITYGWVMSHITYGWVKSYIDDVCHI